MKAIVYERYGTPDVLHLADVPIPVPGPGQVLVRVEAVSLNLSDWECLRGSPLYARIGGLRRPAHQTLGSDIAGRVEAVGAEVTQFAPGDDVFGDNLGLMGGFAEYALAPAKVLAHRPAPLDAAQASTIPQAGAIALQGISDQAAVTEGSHVLINGAGGGSGAFAIQLAKAAGAHVTGVDNAHKLEFMRAIGADEVIDYERVDYTRTGDRYDYVLDLVARRSMFACRRALTETGRYRCVGGSSGVLLQAATLGRLLARGHRLGVLMVKPGPSHFGRMTDLCSTGEVQVHIDRTYPLEEVADALRHVGEGRALGKVVVKVATNG